jgi:hypothetical protein
MESHALIPERLSNHWQGFVTHLLQICTKFDTHLLSDQLGSEHQARHKTPNKTMDISAHPCSCVRFCTLTFKIC